MERKYFHDLTCERPMSQRASVGEMKVLRLNHLIRFDLLSSRTLMMITVREGLCYEALLQELLEQFYLSRNKNRISREKSQITIISRNRLEQVYCAGIVQSKDWPSASNHKSRLRNFLTIQSLRF